MFAILISKIAGPKVLVGILVAATIAVATLGYMLLQAKEQAGSAHQANRQLVRSIKEQGAELSRLHREQDARDRAVMQALAARDRAQLHAEEVGERLNKALADDKCAQAPHPAAVFDSLRLRSGGADQD